MRGLYTLIWYLLLPVLLMRLYWRGYRENWQHRIGFIPQENPQPRIWIHAVSVGEVQAATALIHGLQRHYPDHDIVVSTTTPTGAETLKRHRELQVKHRYFPYDVPVVLRLYLARLQPSLLLIMEKELWPNLLSLCKCEKIPVLLVNARLSQRSFMRYRIIAGTFRSMLNDITYIAAQTRDDAERFKQLGADAHRVSVTGNLKYEVSTHNDFETGAQSLKASLFNDRFVWIAASTHENEEQQLLEIYNRLRYTTPNLLLLLVPRHPQRFEHVYKHCINNELSVIKRSQNIPCSATSNVFLLDTIGELPVFFGAAEIAFIGGSLVPIGGHNPLEAARFSLPILTGPYIENFQEIYAELRQNQGCCIVADKDELLKEMLSLIQNNEAMDCLGLAAYSVYTRKKAVVERLMEKISQVI